MAEPWNHNIHYHRLILDAIPPGARHALDVGCGEGTLARQLRALVPNVTAIDVDPASIDLARQAGPDIEYLLGDFLTYPFHPASFDFIASVATLHHMDAGAALARMRDLLRPGGTLASIGLPRPALPANLPWLLASTAGSA
ncbi:MAG TPA: class I SAM-dependent methyltransferase, partial [Longimicrobium sp.]